MKWYYKFCTCYDVYIYLILKGNSIHVYLYIYLDIFLIRVYTACIYYYKSSSSSFYLFFLFPPWSSLWSYSSTVTFNSQYRSACSVLNCSFFIFTIIHKKWRRIFFLSPQLHKRCILEPFHEFLKAFSLVLRLLAHEPDDCDIQILPAVSCKFRNQS